MAVEKLSGESATAVTRDGAIWMARSRWYGLFAAAFTAPFTGASLRALLSLPFEPAFQALDRDGLLAARWQAVLASSRVLDGDALAARLHAEFDRLFLVPVQGEMVSLAATTYLAPEQQTGERQAWFEQLYSSLGFDWRASLAALPDIGVWPVEPEHASLIFAALAIICQELAGHYDDQLTSSDLRRVLRAIVTKSGDWLQRCLAAVTEQASEPFYRFFAEAAAAFLSVDQEHWEDEDMASGPALASEE